MRRGQRKDLYRRERDSLEGPHEKAEIQRKTLRRGKNLAFSEDTCLEKERVRSKVTPRKVGLGLKLRREPSRRRLSWRLAWGGGGGGPNGHIVSVKRTADGRRQRGRKIINEEREKYRAKNGSLRNTSTDSKGTAFVILKNHRSAPVRKERLSPTSKARREASPSEFVGKGGMPNRVKSFREIVVF